MKARVEGVAAVDGRAIDEEAEGEAAELDFGWVWPEQCLALSALFVAIWIFQVLRDGDIVSMRLSEVSPRLRLRGWPHLKPRCWPTNAKTRFKLPTLRVLLATAESKSHRLPALQRTPSETFQERPKSRRQN